MTLSFSSQINRENYMNRVEKAIQFMASHLSEEVNLEAAANEAGFSPFHFHRIFTAITGETPQNFLNRLRMERAANILVKSPAISITEIAFSCGYGSASAFARSFKRYYGFPAGDYARRCRNGESPNPWVTTKPPVSVIDFSLPDIRIEQMPPLHLATFKSNAGYTPDAIKTVWLKMFQWAQSRGLDMAETRLIAISYDDPEITQMNRCRYYACLTIPPAIQKDSRAGILDLPEHLCAISRLECDPDQILPAYRTFYRDWLPESGFLMTDLPPYEVYINAPEVDPTSKYVFDLCVPVKAL